LHWLGDRPEVDADQVFMWGASRGGEAALLVSSTYPDLVHAVVGVVPADVRVCGLPDCDRPAWTLNGEALAYVDDFSDPVSYLAAHPDVLIPVERIAGPVLLICGGQDDIWPSCLMSHAIIDRLDANSFQFAHELLEYPEAEDFVSTPPPMPLPPGSMGGGDTVANARDRLDAWDKTLDFLAEAGS
jgi:hypothetical protein